MALTQVVVTATYKTPSGSNCAGTVEFVPLTPLQNAGSNIIVPGKTTATLSSGAVSVTLYATDDADTSPDGAVYEVTERITGVDERSYLIELPNANTPVDLADLAPATDMPYTTYALASAAVAKSGDSMTGNLDMVYEAGVTFEGDSLSRFSTGIEESSGVWYYGLSDAVNARNLFTATAGAAGLSYAQILDRLRVVKGTGQTANLLELTDTNGSTVLFGVDASGKFVMNSGSGSATFVANSGTAVNDASTFDGYTLAQVVKALRTIGVLA